MSSIAFVGSFTLEMALEEIALLGGRYGCLIVALDSARGPSLLASRTTLDPLLAEHGLRPHWTTDGPWLDGSQLDALVRSGFLVPFSAVYLFKSSGPPPKFKAIYSNTSESEQFADEVPPELEACMDESGAAGYLADGDGLNLYLVDEELQAALAPFGA